MFIPRVLAEQGLLGVYRDEAFVTKRHPKGIPVSSSSQPGLMATMLELLELRPGQRVLEVGAGTGYNAALIRHLVGASGRVTTIESTRSWRGPPGRRCAAPVTGPRLS